MQNIVVLILNYNSWQASLDYIAQLRKQKQVVLSFLVVDNCSPDGSYEKLFSHYKNVDDVTVLKSTYNGGYAYGNNFGLRYLKNKVDKESFVLITNNDIIIDDELLLKSLSERYYACRDIAFISPVMHINDKPAENCAWKIPGIKYDITTVVGFNRAKSNKTIYYDLPLNQSLFPVACLSGSFFLGKLSTFMQISYFDERTFLYEEERILAQKVKNAELTNYLALNLRFDHINSVIINKEISSVKRLNYLLNSRVIFHKYYANTGTVKVILLKLIYSLYLLFRRTRDYIISYH